MIGDRRPPGISDALASRLRGSSLGLRRGEVRLSTADLGWPVIFHLLAAELVPLLPESAVAVEHIGSTAVPGLAAKPILDVAVGVRSDANPVGTIEAFVSLGFIPRAAAPGDRLDQNFGLELEERVRLVNAHLLTYGEQEWTAYLRFRDRLRADPTARDTYAELKIDLARRFPGDRTSYLDGKDSFVQDSRPG